jgi:hypothetical protein
VERDVVRGEHRRRVTLPECDPAGAWTAARSVALCISGLFKPQAPAQAVCPGAASGRRPTWGTVPSSSGAGVGGLLAARALSEAYERVTVLDRDARRGSERATSHPA